jgi:hypothetical protein
LDQDAGRLHEDHVLISHDAKKHKQELPRTEDAGAFLFLSFRSNQGIVSNAQDAFAV